MPIAQTTTDWTGRRRRRLLLASCQTVIATGAMTWLALTPAAHVVDAAASPQSSDHSTGRLTVGPNVQVSASLPSTMHGEGMIVADPTDASRLVVCAMSIDAHRGHGVVAYASADAGARWARTYETPPDDIAGDPACAFGPDGTAYLTMMPMTIPSMSTMRLPLLRSRDGGRTWQAAGGVTGGLDRESVVVDSTSRRFHNRIYVHGTSAGIRGPNGLRRSMVALYASADGGRTFGPRVEWAALGRHFLFGSTNAVVLSDGRWLALLVELENLFEAPDTMKETRDVYFPPPEPDNVSLKAIASDDGGDTLNDPVTVSGVHLPNLYMRWSNSVPAIAADATDGPFKDRVYAAWADSRFGGTDILLSYSADRGQTWSAPIVVNDDVRPRPPYDDAAPNHLMPALAVNAAGVLAVTWLDRRDAPSGRGWRQRIRVSLDGGETFLPSELVSEAPARFDGTEHWPVEVGTTGGGTPVLNSAGPLSILMFAPRFLYAPGDYAGLAADASGIFHPYWIDNRTGWHQVWTANVRAAGTAVRNGSPALAPLDDLTALTTLKRTDVRFDRATGRVSVSLRLENTGEKTLTGPFVLRLLTLDSQVATVEAVETANGSTGPGATWDFTAAVEDGRLEPGSASSPVTLTFTVHDVQPFQGQPNNPGLGIVRFTARVLGHIDGAGKTR